MLLQLTDLKVSKDLTLSLCAELMKDWIDEIGRNKDAALVTDNAKVVVKACEDTIREEGFGHIIELRCFLKAQKTDIVLLLFPFMPRIHCLRYHMLGQETTVEQQCKIQKVSSSSDC